MWDDPVLYDLENADDPEFDLAYWTGLVRSLAPRRVLEVACGTGRLILPLARLGGFSLVGLDRSEPFLEHARERLAAEPAPVRDAVTLVAGDMRAPSVDGAFDLVAVPFNSLAYLISVEDRLATLHAARSLLAPGGRFAFDLVAPRYDLLAEAMSPEPPERIDADHPAPELGVARFVRWYVDTYDPETQTLHSANRYEIEHADGRVEHRTTELDWHIYFPAELDALLTLAGLRVVARQGGWNGEPWGPAARRLLWVCEAA
jgi:SAM-dependent methyltransferase